MGTAGAYAGVAFSFNYSFVDSATPSSFFATDLTTADVTVYSRTGSTTGAGAAIASAPTRSGSIYTFTLSTSEMTGDEVLLECSKTGMVSETISIALEPTPSDISEVQKSTVAIGDFKADVSSLATSAEIAALNDIAATDIVSAGAITTLAGAVVNVDTVDVTTTNSDMRGTDGAYTGTPASAADVADAVWDEALSGHNSAGSTGKALRQMKEGIISIEGSVNDASATSTTFVSNLTESTDGFYHDKVIVFISGALTGQARHIETYVGSTKSITVSQAFTSAPANADEFLILATHEHSINEIQSGLATSSALATVDANVDQILLDTGTDGVVISTAQAQALADEVLKRSVTNTQDSADAHSLAAIVLGILESSRSSTTWTIKKTTGSTFTTKTLTLDSGADPVIGVD